MIRTAARWYLIVLGVAISVGSWRLIPALLSPEGFSAAQRAVLVTAGLLMVMGGLAGIMRLPGRVPAAYLGIGSGLAAVGQLAGAFGGVGGILPLVIGSYVALALLVITSWSLWPSTG